MIIEKINQHDAIRYMGYGTNKPDENMQVIINDCEKKLLAVIDPRFVYKMFDINFTDEGVCVSGTSLFLKGNSIREHLQGCEKCVLYAATLSQGADREIRLLETSDMTKAMITDCLASAAIEQVCDGVDEIIKEIAGEYNQTWRYSPGYGDLPMDIQKDFLAVLDAQKRIGLNTTENSIMIPRKSVTAIIGLSKGEISQAKRGCLTCNLNKVCQFRKRGEHCGF